ncbi:hypothetical protein LCA32G_1386 [Lacticaseibacillus paracasei]|nr:hypothetical protein LCA32G_1386 [Lacticaseibacillus paracasei]
MTKNVFRFLKDRRFWIATSLVLLGIIVGLIGKNNTLLLSLFLDKSGQFQWTVLAGITAVYSFIYTVYLNAHKDKINLIVKPKVEHDEKILERIGDYLSISTEIMSDINITVGDQIYRFHEEYVESSSSAINDRISTNYSVFLNIREQLELEVRTYSDEDELLREIENLHEGVKRCMKFYKISVSKLRFIEGKRKTMREVPDDLKNELMEDPHQKGIFVSKQVRTNFNDEFKTDRHEVYKTRKKFEF